MRERRVQAAVRAADPYQGLVAVHATPCYDLLVSLRALYNPRTYEATRGWAAATRAALGPDVYERGRFYFQGFDTALGYGPARLIPALGDAAAPADLITAIRAARPADLALLMLDTGETPAESLALFRRHLGGEPDARALDRAFRGVAPEWARRCRRVLAEPAAVQDELATLLEVYRTAAFEAEVPHVGPALVRAASEVQELLGVLRTTEVIERLASGYTFGEDLALTRITLAPSVFVYPFMSARVDERAGEALVVFGVRTDAFLKYDPIPIDPSLVRLLKAIADPGRLRVLKLLGRRPMFGPELVDALGLAQPTVHHHLAQLRAVGLLRQERTKGGMRYTIRRESAAASIGALERLLAGGD